MRTLTLKEHEEQASVFGQMIRSLTPEMYEDIKKRYPERVKRYTAWMDKKRD